MFVNVRMVLDMEGISQTKATRIVYERPKLVINWLLHTLTFQTPHTQSKKIYMYSKQIILNKIQPNKNSREQKYEFA